MTKIIPEVKQIYALNWVIPSIKSRIEDQAVRNIQRLWKSQIIGHFTRTEYTDGFRSLSGGLYLTQHFAYDRYKNIYRAILSNDRLSIIYQKIPDTFESLINDDPFLDLNSHPNFVSFTFNTIVIRSAEMYEEVDDERDGWYLDFCLPFDELPVEAVYDSPDYSLDNFRLECLRLARIYKII